MARSRTTWAAAGESVRTSAARAEEEGALWDGMEEALVPRASPSSAEAEVPTNSFFVVKRRDAYQAVVVECRGTCGTPACGAPFRPGCAATEDCERSAYALDVEFDNDDDAFAWLEGVAEADR